MTNWTKVTDQTTDYGSGNVAEAMLSEDGEFMLMESGEYIVAEGPSTPFTEVADSSERYIPVGVGLKIATESFAWLLTEGTKIRLIHSKTNWSEVGDASTSYTKVEDA